MLLEHEGRSPQVHPTAYIAPNATLCGDVTVGPGCRVLFGAVLTAEGGPIRLGADCIVMENAVVRATAKDAVDVGNHVLIGPTAYLTGCTIANDVFLATGTRVFNGARIGERCEVRINGVVHLRTVLAPGTTVPINWVAVGDPAELLPPDQHDRIWAVQQELDFPGYVFGLDRAQGDSTIMPQMTARYGRALAKHKNDREVP